MQDKIDIETIGEDLPLLEGIRSCRAIRRLDTREVPTALIRKVCEAGTFAPSGGNRQPWMFIAVSEAERKRWIAERYLSAFREYIAPVIARFDDPEYPDAKKRNAKAALHLAEHLHEAPVLLFVAGYTRRGQPQTQALFPAVQNILLACRAVGLGASLTTIHRAHGEEIDSYLGLSPRTPSCVMIPIGWPKGRFGRPPRESVAGKLFFEKYTGDAGA